MSTFMNARGMLFGHMRPSTGHTPGATGGLWGQRPFQGGDLEIFEKKFYFRFLGLLTTIGRHGARIPEMSPRLSPVGATVWELPPKNVIFADYFWRILRIAEVNFRVTSRVDFLSSGKFSAIFRTEVRGSEHPRNRPPKNPRFFAPTFDPLGVPHKNFGSPRICRGTHSLPTGEESARISASNPEIWDSKYLIFGVVPLVQKGTHGIGFMPGDALAVAFMTQSG